jgi:hypothetical protein
MYLWRSLPEGQLLAVLRWMSSRRERLAVDNRLACDASATAVEGSEKSAAPTR